MIKRRSLFQIACDRCGRSACFTEDHDNAATERRLLGSLVEDGWDVSISRQGEFQTDCSECVSRDTSDALKEAA